MKKIITTIASFMLLGITLYAQFPALEWRIERESYLNSSMYQFDVVLYNTASSSMEIRGGTMALLYNTNWLNGGSLGSANNPANITYTNYGLVAAQQTSLSNTGSGYFSKAITTVGAGSGTTVPAYSKIRMFTVTIQNVTSTTNSTPINFLATTAPNLAWKFNASPYAGLNYTEIISGQNLVATAISNIVNPNFCYNNSYWTGSAWSMGSSTTINASTATPPSSSTDFTLYNGNYSQAGAAENYHNLTILLGTTFTTGAGNSTNVYGDLVIDGTFDNTGGTLALFGGGSHTISGATPKLIANGISFRNASATYTSLVPIEITAWITDFYGGFKLLANAGITLKSTSSSTAYVGKLLSGSDIIGTMTVERYIPAHGRRWRFLSSPVVGGTTMQWRDNAGSTPGRGIQITGSKGTVDSSSSNLASVYWYNEASAIGGSNTSSKWEALDGNTALTNGRGYRVFVRGDRTLPLITPTSTNNPTTIWVAGNYPDSSINLPITFNENLGNGWNLVGNPYPSPIGWDNIINRTNVDNKIWIWNPQTNSYGSYDGATTSSSNGVTNRISSGQAFFIQTIGTNPSLIINENCKDYAGAASEMFKTFSKNTLRINLVKDSTESDETVIRYMDDRSDSFNVIEDVSKPMMNPNVNLGSYFGVGNYAMINYLNTKSIDGKIIPLMASVSQDGIYNLNFSQIESFDSNVNIFLRDNYTNTLTDLRANNKYSLKIDANQESTKDGRLELVFAQKSSSIESVLANRHVNLDVYPNPIKENGTITIELANANFNKAEVSVYNISGLQEINTNMSGNKLILNVETLSSGIYFIKVSNTEIGYSNIVKFIK